jgi:hypothetical protein
MAAKSREESEAARVKRWAERLAAGDKIYTDWEEQFEIKTLERYYEGFQWAGLSELEAKDRYTINLFFGSIETSKPALLFYRPQFRVTPRPGRADDWGSTAEARAKLSEDTIQTFVDDPKVGFALETSLALQESFTRFGIIEVGYSADFLDNPLAGKPVLKENSEDPLLDSEGKEVLQPSKVLAKDSEALYVRQIPASQFRVSVSGKNRTDANDWVAYWEWVYLEDVKRNPEYENVDSLKATGVLREKLRPVLGAIDTESKFGMIKIWKVWDLRRQKRHVLADGHKRFLQEDKAFTFLPLAALKFIERPGDWYPLPTCFNWLSPQNELNEEREQQKAHRRRFERKYTISKGAMEATEVTKLIDGGDGTVAEDLLPVGAGASPMKPVPDAPLDPSVWRGLIAGKEDFMQVSGISSDQRGQADKSETATQANIVETRSRIRETSARTKVADWLGQIGRLILLTAREHMAMPFWIKQSVDPAGPGALLEAVRVAQLWKQIESKDLGDLDLDVSVDLASLSPVTEDMQRTAWNQVIALLSNPAVLQVLAGSEHLLRKTLGLYGIKAENDIREIQKAIQPMAAQMAMAQGAASGAAVPPGPAGMASGQPAGGPAQLAASLERMAPQ